MSGVGQTSGPFDCGGLVQIHRRRKKFISRDCIGRWSNMRGHFARRYHCRVARCQRRRSRVNAARSGSQASSSTVNSDANSAATSRVYHAAAKNSDGSSCSSLTNPETLKCDGRLRLARRRKYRCRGFHHHLRGAESPLRRFAMSPNSSHLFHVLGRPANEQVRPPILSSPVPMFLRQRTLANKRFQSPGFLLHESRARQRLIAEGALKFFSRPRSKK